jgi:hypothetical protein
MGEGERHFVVDRSAIRSPDVAKFPPQRQKIFRVLYVKTTTVVVSELLDAR